MPEITITLTAEQEKALAEKHGDVQPWLQGFVDHLAAQAIDAFVEEHTDFQARKKTDEEKNTIVATTAIAAKEA